MARAHATLSGVVERARLKELAEKGSPNVRVNAQLLGATLDGSDRSAYTAQERTDADAAVDHLQRRVDDANVEVDSYLARYPQLTTTDDLAVYAYDIALYRILGGQRESERYERYRAALRYLQAVAAGDINLDLDDDETGDSGTGARARFKAQAARFKREDLANA